MSTLYDPSTIVPFSGFDSASILAPGNTCPVFPLASGGDYGQPPITHTGFFFEEPEFDVATLQNIAASLATPRLVIAHEHDTATNGKKTERPSITVHVTPRHDTEAAILERIKQNLKDGLRDHNDLDRKPTSWKEVE